MKKIAILAPYVGTINRGAETFVIELTKKLQMKYEVDVYTQCNEPSIESSIRIVDVKVNRAFRLHKYLYEKYSFYREIVNRFYFIIPEVIFQKKFTKSAFKVIDNEKYDLIFPNNGIWGAKYASCYRKKNKTPFIYTGHGGIGIGEKYIIDEAPNAYICLTDKHLKWANSIRTNEHTKMVIIPNGVCVSSFIPRINNKGKTIISVGALTAFKRHQLTIRAVARIPEMNLIILGKGEEEKQLIKMADTLLPGRCTIASTRYDSIKNYYAKADLFVLPSEEEPFGIVYLEAMASNLPIVAPNDSQRREIIGEAGLFCDVVNPEEYANTIKKAFQIDWGTIPLERAKMFDWSAISKRYIELIEEVLENKLA